MKHFLLYSKLLSENKAFEAQVSGFWNITPDIFLKFELFGDRCWFSIQISLFGVIDLLIAWSRKQDHAGFYFEAKLAWFFLLLNLYDTRHWNYDADRFYLDDEEEL